MPADGDASSTALACRADQALQLTGKGSLWPTLSLPHLPDPTSTPAHALPCFVPLRLSALVASHSALPCPALPCPALPCPALPCPAYCLLYPLNLPQLTLLLHALPLRFTCSSH